MSILQVISGDISARWVAENQPVKFAAMEGHFETEERAPLVIGGWPDLEMGETNWAIRIPGLLSFLAHGSLDSTVMGLNDVPMDEQPEPRVVHPAFQVMVGSGVTLILVSSWFWLSAWRAKRISPNVWLLRALFLTTPLGFIAIEAGWIVTEVGRQPWIIYEIMRTEEAVTQVPGQFAALGGFTILYVILAAACTWLLLLLAKHPPMLPDNAPATVPSKEAPHAVA